MKNKKRRKLRTYGTMLLCAFVCIFLFLEHFVDFFLGFFAGFYQAVNGVADAVDWEYAKTRYGTMSRIAGWITVILIIIIASLVYIQMKKKVAQPIEQLADGMRRVSQGDLAIRVPVNGDFEFEQMQESFNYMVEELDKAKQSRELMEQRNQQLYAGIAHDLKTPMTMIIGYAKVLEKNVERSLEERTKENSDAKQEIPPEDKLRYLKTIIEQTEHANALLDSLLAYSKLQNQSYHLQRERRDIAECLRTCVADYYPILEEAKIQMELLLPEGKVEFSFDEVEMKRVFANLLSNMVKHNPKGTACIIQLEEICTEADNKVIRIVVADNGSKITEELQKILFDSFAVGDSSRNTKNGSGLGLSISKKIIERHDGEICYINDWKDGYKGFAINLKSENRR